MSSFCRNMIKAMHGTGTTSVRQGLKGKAAVMTLLLILSVFNSIKSYSQLKAPEYDEISVLFQVESFGNFYASALYSSDGKLYVSVEELFENLRIPFSPLTGKPGIEGFIAGEDNRYSFDYSSSIIIYNKNSSDVSGRIIKSSGTEYLESSAYGSIFGIHIVFTFRSLSATVKSDSELPGIKEKRLEEARNRISKAQGIEVPADTILKREYHTARYGTADWYLMSNQVWNHQSDVQAGIGLGAELLGGETDVFINYSDKYKFDKRMQNYLWRWVDNGKSLVRQVRLGRVVPQTISSLYYPVVGASVSNTPTTTRRATGEYTIKDFTEPDWLVELYINNELTDYTRADASGMFVFKVPLVYGFTTLTLRFYGPMGEERSDTRTINLPYSFMPAGEFEYNINGGFLQDGKASPYGRAETAYGVSRTLTVGAGLEYLSTIPGKPAIPFLKASYLPFSKLILTGEYDDGVRIKGTANYYPVSSILVEGEYTRYMKDQKAILYNYLEEKKLSVSVPGRIGNLSGFARLGYKQNVYSDFNYNIAELLLSGYYKSFSANISTYANWMNDRSLYINSTAALSWRLKYGITLRTTAQMNLSQGKILLFKEEFEKRFAKTNYMSVYYEDNLAISSRSVNVSIKFDLNFLQASSSGRVSNGEVSTFQGVRGSLMFGRKTQKVQADAASNVGRGGLTIIPFLDINNNGKKDRNERNVENLNVKISGARIKYIAKDTVISVSGLEPFIMYEVELSDRDFENIAWRISKKRYDVIIDPNQFKIIEVPVIPMGEVNGMITMVNDSIEEGMGRVIVRIFDKSGKFVAETLSEQDGYWSYLGLEPGEYFSSTDSVQRSRLNLRQLQANRSFTINPDENGEIVSDINYSLLEYPVAVENSAPVSIPESINPADSVIAVKTDKPAEEKVTVPSSENTAMKEIMEEVIPSETGTDTGMDLYYIQAGSYKNIESASQLTDRIRSLSGFAIGFARENNLNKLRLGYFRDKKDAVDAGRALSEKNIPFFIGKGHAVVFEGDLDLTAGNHFVQTGAFRNEKNAREYLKVISGITKYPTGIIIEDGYYKIRIGYFSTASEAEEADRFLKDQGHLSFRAGAAYYSK